MSAPTVAQLKAEILTDPAGLGYLAKLNANDPEGAALLINTVNAAITVKRIDVAASEILEAIDVADAATGVSTLAISAFESMTQQQRLRLVAEDGSDTRILKNIKACFLANGAAGANPQTRARLNAVAIRTGSRAEQLWGAGVVVTGSDMATAVVS